MKEFMTGIAMLIILCVFLTQFTVNQVVQNKVILAENDINTFVEDIRRDGYVTDAAKTELKARLKTVLKLPDDSEIVVEGTPISQRKKRSFSSSYEDSLIYYRIEYPIKNVIGASEFLGISDSENEAIRIREGKTASEYIEW